MKFTEEQLKKFASPISDTEDQMCKNAIEMVRDALKRLGLTDDGRAITPLYSDTYAYALEMRTPGSERQVKIFSQGSYANNTNVRKESDVDVAIVQEEVFYPNYRAGIIGSAYGFFDVPTPYKSFKDEVQDCLIFKFGSDVERKDKSIKVHGNLYRKDADTVPCRRYRDYSNDFQLKESNYVGGIVIYPDSGGKIINYPEQHIVNGRAKNNDTNYYYKKMVRIIKNIRNIMEDNNCLSSTKVTSFGLESMLWNVPNDIFLKYTFHRYIFGEVTQYLSDNKQSLSTYKEANGIKPLCQSLSDVFYYDQFVTDLKGFYQYDI
jgi:hypothetical protein